jgi:poly-beta-1,6-N-acetyl-D-glucosamine synthase
MQTSVNKKQFGPYVLMTAAYNEEAYIEKTIQSVLSQTLLPQRWVIVSDNSTDRTDQIAERYAAKHDFIRVLHITRKPGHNFGAKVVALRQGEELLRELGYDFIGNLDADLSLENDYFEELIKQFSVHSRLGIASGFVHEDDGSGFKSRWFNTVNNVPHAAQLVRRECYEQIGGYAVLKYGGEDWYAQTCAKMKGWQVESIPRLKIFHHRHTGASSHPIRNAFRLGRLDYSFGSDPIFEIMKCVRKMKDRPYLLAGITRITGFIWCYLCGEKRPVPEEFVDFLRREQKSRLFSLFNRPTLAFPGEGDR